MKVVLPNPDSPATCSEQGQNPNKLQSVGATRPTIMVKAAPRFATILCLLSSACHSAEVMTVFYTVDSEAGLLGLASLRPLELRCDTYIGNADW